MSSDAVIARNPIPVYPFLTFLLTDSYRVSRVTNTQIEQRVRRISSADSISPLSITSLGGKGKEIDYFVGLLSVVANWNGEFNIGSDGPWVQARILREMERAPKEPDLVGVELR